MFRRSMPLMKKHVENWKAITQSLNVPVVKNARQVLIQLYRKTLEEIKQVPVTAAYRQNVEGITKYRLNCCESSHSHKEIELAVEAGIIEEIVEQAKMELELIPLMLKEKPWEVPEDWEPPKMNIDGFYFDWMKLRQERVENSFKLRSEMSEDERKALLEQWFKDSNPDNEIYPPELVAHKSKGCFVDLSSFKGVRFGA